MSSFFVCFFKDKDGNEIAHADSPRDEFPDEIEKTIEIGPRKETEISEIFSEFCRSIVGYIDMLPLLNSLSSVITRLIREKELKEFCENNHVNKTSYPRKAVFEIDIKDYFIYREINEKSITSNIVSKQVPKMLVIGFVSSLDYHISRLMKLVLAKYPKMISDSDKQVSVRDIFKSGDLNEFKEYLLDREVDNITRDTFEEQVSWFEKKLSISKPIKDNYEKWSSLVEIIERRNLFAHADGIVNTTYLKKVASDIKQPKAQKGDELYASPKYFKNSLENICEFGVKICQVVWRKIEPEQSQDADDALGDFGYRLIERGEYKLAIEILEFAVNEIKSKKSEIRRRMDIVNLANAYKLDDNMEKCLAVLSKEDWSIVSDSFAISVAAVRGDIDAVIAYMKRLAQSGEWDGRDLEQWPVFFSVRDQVRFQEEFERLYKRKFAPAPKLRNKLIAEILKKPPGTVSKRRQVGKTEASSTLIGGASKKKAVRSRAPVKKP
jgi:hypothetical protein